MTPKPTFTRLAVTLVVATGTLVATPHATHAAGASATGDAIFAIGEGGALEPIAVRRAGTFVKPGSNEGGPSQTLAHAAAAALAGANKRVNVLFGGRVIATVPAKLEHDQATITIPASLHLTGHVSALASTLGGYAKSPRRAPTAHERGLALATAAQTLHTTAAHLTVRNLTAIDLGHGMALVGTVDLRGTGTPRTDKRLFFVDDGVPSNTNAYVRRSQTSKRSKSPSRS